MGSHWTGGERIGVRIGDNEEMGIYIINVDDAGNVTVTPETPVYWKNTQPAEVTAWYPATDGALYLGGQDNGLVYVLRATADNASHNTPVNLQFEHQLAKVRVVTTGTANVTDIKLVNVPTYCHIEEGKITKQEGSTSARIDMLQVEREGIGTCWEANVGPDVELKHFEITILIGNGMTNPVCELSSPVITQAGALHTITWTVNNKGTQSIRLSTDSIGSNGTEQSQ